MGLGVPLYFLFPAAQGNPVLLYPPPPHSVGLGVHSIGLTAPIVYPHPRGFCSLNFLPDSIVSPLPLPRPMAAPRPRLVGGRGGGFPFVAPAGPRIHS